MLCAPYSSLEGNGAEENCCDYLPCPQNIEFILFFFKCMRACVFFFVRPCICFSLLALYMYFFNRFWLTPAGRFGLCPADVIPYQLLLPSGMAIFWYDHSLIIFVAFGTGFVVVKFRLRRLVQTRLLPVNEPLPLRPKLLWAVGARQRLGEDFWILPFHEFPTL